MIFIHAVTLRLRRTLLQDVSVRDKLLLCRSWLCGRDHPDLVFIVLALGVPVMSCLSNLLLRAYNHLNVSAALLLRGVIHRHLLLSSTDDLNKVSALVGWLPIGPLLSPLLHGIISNLLSLTLLLELLLGAL